MNAKHLAIAWCGTAATQRISMFTQAVLAELALSGSFMALTAHMFSGIATFLLAALYSRPGMSRWVRCQAR